MHKGNAGVVSNTSIPFDLYENMFNILIQTPLETTLYLS